MKFAIFRRKFDEILPEFHRNVQEMTNCLEILRRSARKIRKMLEIYGICEKFSFFISFFVQFQFHSVSLFHLTQGGLFHIDPLPPGPLVLQASASVARSNWYHRFLQILQIFRRLVLGWIDADFCVQILILQHFSRSTKLSG